jgi:hypothetical protein
MKTVQLWDKEPFNGVTLKDIYSSFPAAKENDFITVKEGNSVVEFQDLAVIRQNLGLPNDTANEAVCVAYQKGFDEQPTVVEQTPLEVAISEKLKELTAFDTSEDGSGVNNFLVQMGDNKVPAWIDALTRASYLNLIESYKKIGRTIIELPLLGQMVKLPIDIAEDTLHGINAYGGDSAVVTAKHEVAIKALTTIEEVDAYDFTVGYPDKVVVPLG